MRVSGGGTASRLRERFVDSSVRDGICRQTANRTAIGRAAVFGELRASPVAGGPLEGRRVHDGSPLRNPDPSRCDTRTGFNRS